MPRSLVTLPECGQILRVPHGRLETSGPRNVDVKADAGTDPTLHRTPGPRVEIAVVVPVQRHVEDGGVVVEDLGHLCDGSQLVRVI